MDSDKKAKDNLFITMIVLGTSGVFVANVTASDAIFFTVAIGAFCFLVILYAIFYGFPFLHRKTTERISDFKKTRQGKLEFDAMVIDDKDYFLRIRNSGKYTVKKVRVQWGGMQVETRYPNEEYKRFESWVREEKTLEWKGTKSDVITITKDDFKDAHMFEVHKDES